MTLRVLGLFDVRGFPRGPGGESKARLTSAHRSFRNSVSTGARAVKSMTVQMSAKDIVRLVVYLMSNML